MSPTEYAIWVAVKLAQTALFVRLIATRQIGQYPAFGAYLLLSIFSSAVLYTVGQNAYDTIWLWVTPALLLSLALTVLEAHWKIQEHVKPLRHPHIATAIMVGAAAFVAWLTLEATAWASRYKAAALGIRFTTATLACWMILQAALFPRIDPPLPANLASHGRILAIFLFIQASTFAAINLLSPYAPREVLSIGLMSANTACCIAWLIAFWRK